MSQWMLISHSTDCKNCVINFLIYVILKLSNVVRSSPAFLAYTDTISITPNMAIIFYFTLILH